MRNSSNFHWILDNGHGGFINGEYTTAPAKMYKHKDGTVVYEGLFNRQVVQKIAYLLGGLCIDFEYLVPESNDVSLSDRVKRVRDIAKRVNKPTVMVSVHGNAGKGTGYEVFTTKGQTLSDPIADIFVEEIAKEFPSKRQRVDITDGDLDKEANFTILMCKGAAVLTENFFMDNIEDAKLMLSDLGQSKIAIAHVEAIKRVESLGLDSLKKNIKKKK